MSRARRPSVSLQFFTKGSACTGMFVSIGLQQEIHLLHEGLDAVACPCAGRMLVSEGEKLLIARNLLKRKLVRPRSRGEIISAAGQPI